MPHDVQAILDAIRECDVVDLEQTRSIDAPIYPSHRPGFLYSLHRRHEAGSSGARTSASGLIVAAEHSGTHLDALSHQAEGMKLHGGIDITPAVQTPAGFTQLGVETVAPMLTRGVLLDVAAARGGPLPERYQITVADLEACEQRQGVSVRQGDMVAVRTGFGQYWESPERYEGAAGVSAAGSQWLADRAVQAVGSDNLSWDVSGYTDETTGTTLPGHVILLVRAGIYIIENLRLEELSAREAYEFVFVCLPLKMIGVTGSPVRPIALVPAGQGKRQGGE